MHIHEDILDTHGKIDPHKIDLVARLGADWYCRVNSDSLFKIDKPLYRVGIGIGVDAFPDEVINSNVLTGNNLGLLGLIAALPTNEEVIAFSKTEEMKEILDLPLNQDNRRLSLHLKAKGLLENGRVMDACKVLLM